LKDYEEYLEERLDGMYSVLESSNSEIMEGFMDKIKTWKTNRQNKKRNKLMNYYNVISKCEKMNAEDEFDDVVDKLMNILRREIPSISFNKRNVCHSVKNLGNDYSLHEYTLNLVTLNTVTKRKFVYGGNNKSLKAMVAAHDATKVAKVVKKVDDVRDYYKPKTMDEWSKEEDNLRKRRMGDAALDIIDKSLDYDAMLMDEIVDRIFGPLFSSGFVNMEDQSAILYKNNKEFITVNCDNYFEFSVTMQFIINDAEVVNEGFLANLKEKRAAKKAAKEEKRNQQMLRDLLIVDEKKFPQYEKEFNSLIKYMITVLKREVPGCTFVSQEVRHSEKNITGHVIHRFSLGLFDLTDENFKKFISKSKNPELKEAENTWDCVDELIQDTFERIGKPLESKGYSYDENRVYSKDQGGKEYIFVDLGDEAAFSVYMYMDIAVKKDEE
jgi:hypothetical protein